MDTQSLKRCLSYNDIKKRRMLRSYSKDKLISKTNNTPLCQEYQSANQRSQVNTPTQDIDHFITDLRNIVEKYDRSKRGFDMKGSDNSQIEINKKILIKTRQPKLTPSHTSKNLIRTTKLKKQTIGRINFCKNINMENGRTQQVSIREDSNKENIELLNINAMSPIINKNSDITQRNDEVSGFSLLGHFQPAEEQNINKPTNMMKKKKTLGVRKSKKILPMDFFR